MKKRTHAFYIAAIVLASSTPAIASTVVSSSVTSQTSTYNEETNSIVRTYVVQEVTENPTFRQRFFSQAQSSPYSDAELAHEYTANDELAFESRTAKCDSVGSYEQFYDCMFRPWNYGF